MRLFETAFWPFGKVERREVTDDERARVVASLQLDYLNKLDAKSVGFAQLLMDENRRVCEWKIASVRELEKKAIAFIAVAGTILTLLAAFGRDLAFGYRAIPILLLVVAVMAYIKACYIRSGALPSAGHFLSTRVIEEPLNEARFALLTAGAWHQYGLDLEVANKTKARYVRTGNFWLVAALFAIVAVVFLPSAPNSPGSGVNKPSPCPSMRSLQHVRRREAVSKSGRQSAD